MRNWIDLFETSRKTMRSPKYENHFVQGRIEPTDANLKTAKEFLMIKWLERFKEKYPRLYDAGSQIPLDLSNSCKFTSLFVRDVFGGKIRGNEYHQFVQTEEGQIIDLNIDAEDVQQLKSQGVDPHQHDDKFWGHHEHQQSVESCKPRVAEWVAEFLREHGDA